MNWYKYARNKTIVIYDFDDTIACGTTNLQRMLNIGKDKPYVWLNDFLHDYNKYGNSLYIMTARMSRTLGDCRKLIRNFLFDFGIDFPESHIICVGFLPSSQGNKSKIVRQILNNNDIEELIFIDDDPNNRQAIYNLQSDYPKVDIRVI